ncbi:TPA: hypothetical protein ACFK3P_00795 [Neisseria gonorrhoeae]
MKFLQFCVVNTIQTNNVPSAVNLLPPEPVFLIWEVYFSICRILCGLRCAGSDFLLETDC